MHRIRTGACSRPRAPSWPLYFQPQPCRSCLLPPQRSSFSSTSVGSLTSSSDASCLTSGFQIQIEGELQRQHGAAPPTPVLGPSHLIVQTRTLTSVPCADPAPISLVVHARTRVRMRVFRATPSPTGAGSRIHRHRQTQNRPTTTETPRATPEGNNPLPSLSAPQPPNPNRFSISRVLSSWESDVNEPRSMEPLGTGALHARGPRKLVYQ